MLSSGSDKKRERVSSGVGPLFGATVNGRWSVIFTTDKCRGRFHGTFCNRRHRLLPQALFLGGALDSMQRRQGVARLAGLRGPRRWSRIQGWPFGVITPRERHNNAKVTLSSTADAGFVQGMVLGCGRPPRPTTGSPPTTPQPRRRTTPCHT